MLHEWESRWSRRIRRRGLFTLMALLARSSGSFFRHHHDVLALSAHRTKRPTPRSFAVGSGRRRRDASGSSTRLRKNEQQQLGLIDHEVERTVVVLYHKPRHVVTSHNAANDPLGRRTVYDDVRSMAGYVATSNTSQSASAPPSSSLLLAGVPTPLEFHDVTRIRPTTKLHAVGRLDAETTGLLLLTNDGALVHHVTHSKEEDERDDHGRGVVIDKTYEAVIMGHHEESSPLLAAVRNGVDLGPKGGGRTRPPRHLVVLGHPSRTTTLISITISEGRNRQIRRTFHAVGSGVMQLKRVRIGPDLTLEGLEKEGSWRVLSDDEVRDKVRWTPRQLEGHLSMRAGSKRKGKVIKGLTSDRSIGPMKQSAAANGDCRLFGTSRK